MATVQRFFVGMILLGIVTSASTGFARSAPTSVTKRSSVQSTSPAALLTRTFVSAQRGSDGNPCTPTSPCRTFTAALAAATIGGEITVLDSGGYGPVTIGKAIQIEAAPGIYAGLSSAAGNGIDVSADFNSVVVIRGLTINGMKPDGTNSTFIGINATNVGSLYVENCVITGGNIGITFKPPFGPADAGILAIKDTLIRNTSGGGVSVQVPGGMTSVTLDRVRLEADRYGLVNEFKSLARVTIRDSVVIGNSITGVSNISGSFGQDGRITVENCAILNNTSGLAVNGMAQIQVGRTLISGNDNGLAKVSQGGTFISFGNNRLTGANTVDGAFDVTVTTK